MIKIPKQKVSSFPRFLIILSIPLLMFCTLFLAYIKYISLKTEFHTIIIIGFILLIFLMFIKHNAWYSYTKYNNSIHETTDKIDEYLKNNQLEISGRKKAYGNINHFFDNQLRKIRNDHFANTAASIFPTLGILGTFTAIAISMPDFSVESQSALDQEITKLLSGVGTAFYASIYGIFLSLWWVFFEKRGLTKIQNSIDETKEDYKEKIWNKEEIEILTLMQNKSHNENLLTKLEDTVNPQFIQTLNNIVQSKIELFQKLNTEHLDFESKLTDTHKKLLESFDLNAKKQVHLLKNYEKLHEQMLQMNSGAANSLSEYNTFAKALKSEIYSVLASFELISSDIKSLGQDMIRKKYEDS
ncbi:MAG: MotA/TolQ/ExbB proton channel family protein [Campylobacteraceae bacterium]|nr:MotA/TolQ/ExbB proton channel family protein [Campylobacteraceae bacterium]